jgi:hypothetical protein
MHLYPKDPPPYFPTWVGAKWVYLTGVVGVFGEQEETRSVTAVEWTTSGVLVTVSKHESDGKTSLHEKVLITSAGLKYVEGYMGKPASPQCMLKVPSTDGEKWEADYSVDYHEHKQECTSLVTEKVEVPAGRFTAVRVRVQTYLRDFIPGGLLHGGTCKEDIWYAPGVGVVKIEYGPSSTWVLKSFTP